MNILITYFSQTGNTEKIAKAIYDEINNNNSVMLQLLDQVKINELEKYDLLFIGSPCHAGDIAAQVKNFLTSLPDKPRFSIAGFITHASPLYQSDDFEKCKKSFISAFESKKIPYQGSFHCQGYLSEKLHQFVKNMKKISDEDWTAQVEMMKGHPNLEDELNAKKFARDIINSIKNK